MVLGYNQLVMQREEMIIVRPIHILGIVLNVYTIVDALLTELSSNSFRVL